MDESTNTSRRVLNKRDVDRFLHTTRVSPGDEYRDVISHVWVLRWDLPTDQQVTVRTIGGLGCSFVWSGETPKLFGVQRGVFHYRLRRAGRITGCKLTPAGVRMFTTTTASEFTDRAVDLKAVVAIESPNVDGFHTLPDNMIARTLEAWVSEARGPMDSRIGAANLAAQRIEEQRGLLSVSALAGQMNVSVRTLQKLFKDYIGVPAKWAIERTRVIEVVATLEQHETCDLAAVATKLGYYDQAHMTNAFRKSTGLTPREFHQRRFEIETGLDSSSSPS
jgi:AraC-like DNA-binding protein